MAVLALGCDAPASSGGDGGPVAATIQIEVIAGLHPGSTEQQVFNQLLAAFEAEHPEIDVVHTPVVFEDLHTTWDADVTARRASPSLFTAPNDSFGEQVRSGTIANLTADLEGRLGGMLPIAIEGMSAGGELYGVPLNVKAIGLCYNASRVATPPSTTDELLAMLAAGASGRTLTLTHHPYFAFAFLTAFGSEVFDETGRCIVDGSGGADPALGDAAEFVYELYHRPGTTLGGIGVNPASTFTTGGADMYLCGPWEISDLQGVLGDDLRLAPIPGDGTHPARPLVGIDGWYVNPHAPNREALVELALFMTSRDAQALYAERAAVPPARSDVSSLGPLTSTFVSIAAGGFVRPQSEAFHQFWGPFVTMLDAVRDASSAAEARAAMDTACNAMNAAIDAR